MWIGQSKVIWWIVLDVRGEDVVIDGEEEKKSAQPNRGFMLTRGPHVLRVNRD